MVTTPNLFFCANVFKEVKLKLTQVPSMKLRASAKSQFPLQLYCLFGFTASICKVESSGKFIKLYFFGLIWPYDGLLCQNFIEFGSV